MKNKKNIRTGTNKLSIVGFVLGVLSVLCVLWELFGVLAIVGLILSVLGLFETLKDKNKLFYPVAGIILGIIFSFKLLYSALIYLCSSYNNITGSLVMFCLVLGLVLLSFAIYYLRNKQKNNLAITGIVVGSILIIIFIVSFIGVSNTEDRLKFKLKEYAKEFFETDSWMDGEVKVDTYTITLEDLSRRLEKDTTIFKKYNCNVKNTKVEFVVHPQLRQGQTNYTYNIVLDCDL